MLLYKLYCVLYCINCFFVLIVISAEVMDAANLLNVVFPASPDQLGKFSQELNETVKIEIPAKSLRLLSAGDEGAGIILTLCCELLVYKNNLKIQEYMWFILCSGFST